MMHTRLRRAACAGLAATLLAGCASTAQVYQPIVDPAIGDPARYPAALAECRTFAEQVGQGGAAAGGAVVGSVLFGVLGAVVGLRGQALAQMAGAGAVIGGVQSGAYAGLTQAQIIQRCLANRGYAVLG